MFLILWLLIIVLGIAINYKSFLKDVKFSAELRKEMIPKHFLLGFVSFIIVFILAFSLYQLHPILQFGWLFSLVQSRDNTPDTEMQQEIPYENIITISLYGFIFLALIVFMLLIPRYAYNEEVMFRKRYIFSSRKTQVIQSIKFGLTHLIMGIPIAAALALSVAGYIFMITARNTTYRNMEQKINAIDLQYIQSQNEKQTGIILLPLTEESIQEGIKQSALVHSAHNYIAVSVIIITSMFSLIQNI